MTTILVIIALIFFILMLILIKKDRVNFLNGVFFTITLVLLGLAVYIKINSVELETAFMYFINNKAQYITYFVAILLIYNGVYNTLSPQRTRKNNITDLLSFFSGITLIMLGILINKRQENIFFIINILIFYIDAMFISYIANSIIYKITTKKESYDIIIVLGAGLVNGVKPSRTLQSRLNKAIEIYKLNPEAIVIVSGGKGSNERISEAEAMKKYLIEKEIPENKIILEDKSTTTYENFVFSKKKIIELGKENAKIAFVSSDFHIYRAANFAKFTKLKATGIGSKSLYYYYPNGFIREFAAIIVRYKIAFILYLVSVIITYIIIK